MMPQSKLKLRIDNFFTDTRIEACMAFKCKFHTRDAMDCEMKRIQLSANGNCCNYQEKRENNDNNT